MKKSTSLEELKSHILLGVVHEMNNPNTFIRMNAINEKKLLDLLKPCFAEYLKNHPDARFGPYDLNTVQEKLEIIHRATLDATERLIQITSKLKQTASASLEEPKEFDLVELLEDVAFNKKLLFKDDIQVKLLFDDNENFLFTGHRIQIEQALRSIHQNALEAITKRLETEPSPGGEISISLTKKEGDYFIEFADNGCGMTQESLDKICEPFYTTKGSGKSRGLGMALCNEVITSHGGAIKIRSHRDKGTQILLTLPIQHGN